MPTAAIREQAAKVKGIQLQAVENNRKKMRFSPHFFQHSIRKEKKPFPPRYHYD